MNTARVCTPQPATCDPVTEYESVSPDEFTARVCSPDVTEDSCPVYAFFLENHIETVQSECVDCPEIIDNMVTNRQCEDICGRQFDLRCDLADGSTKNTGDRPVMTNPAEFLFSDFICSLGYHENGQQCTQCNAVEGFGDALAVCSTDSDQQLAYCTEGADHYVVPTDAADFGCSAVGCSCQPHTVCTSGQYIAEAAGRGKVNQYDRVCLPIADQCDGINNYETQAPVQVTNPADAAVNHVGQNRVCTAQPDACDGVNNYETTAPDEFTARVCTAQPDQCDGDNFYETTAPDVNTARVCTAQPDACDPATEYESVAPGEFVARVCAPLVGCAADEYELSPPTANSQRVCKRCDAAGDQYGVPQHSKALVATCTKDGSSDGAVVSTCKSGFKASGNKCVFDLDATEHIGRTSDCKFVAVDTLFAFAYTYNSDDVTPDFALNNIDIAVWRNTVLFLGRTTVDFQLTNFESVKDAVTYYDNGGGALATGSFPDIATYCYIKPDVGTDDANIQTDAAYKALKFDANGQVDESGTRGCEAGDEIRYIVPFSYVNDGGASAWNDVAKHFTDENNNPVAYVLQDTESVGAQKFVGVASKCGTGAGSDATSPSNDIYAWGTLSGTLQQDDKMSISMNFNDARDTSATGEYGDKDLTGLTLTGVSFEIRGDISARDLLYVLGDQSDAQDNVDASLSNSVAFTGEITLPELSLPLSGNVEAGGSASTTCTANIVVTSHDADEDGNGDYTCFADTPGECQVKLDVDCVTREVDTMYIYDTRTCDSTTNPVGCSGHTPVTVSVYGITHDITVNTAIVDALRMGNTRAYPHNDVSLANPGNANSLDEFEDFTDFTCVTAACDTDAFILLDTGSGTHSGECKWEGSAGSSVSIAQTSGYQTWSGICSNSDSSPGSIGNTVIVTPSETFVQFYVYGIATFDTTADTDTLITAGRRLGAPQESGEVTSKTIMLIAPRSVIQH